MIFLERTSFKKIWRKYHILMYFFLERSSFIFCLSKIIFSGKRNIIFPDNTRKIIFQCTFLLKDHLLRTFGKRKYVFSYSVIGIDLSRQVNAIIPQQINFVGKLEEDNGATMLFSRWKAAKNYFKLFFSFIKLNRIIETVKHQEILNLI